MCALRAAGLLAPYAHIGPSFPTRPNNLIGLGFTQADLAPQLGQPIVAGASSAPHRPTRMDPCTSIEESSMKIDGAAVEFGNGDSGH